MNGLLFLTSEDFTVKKGSKGNIMCHEIPGFSLIFFYSTTQCDHCPKLIPIFKKLPGTIGGCQFGMVNVIINRQCVNMSKNTIAPITYVPYIVLYIDGKPFMRYNGPYDEREIRRFILEVANKIRSKQQFSSENIKDDKKSIPEYTIGHPVCGADDKVCYLEFNDAYGDK